MWRNQVLVALVVSAAAILSVDAQNAASTPAVATTFAGQNATAPAVSGKRVAPAPAPGASKTASTAAKAASPPPVVYAPKRSFGQWCRDLPHDPALLVGFIISLLSGLGFLFIIYTVLFELVMGIPFKRRSYLLGGSTGSNALSSLN